MPSVRKLKKDIDYLIFEVISDCFSFGARYPEDKAEELSGIISDAVSLRNDLIRRVNNPVKDGGPGTIKTHFRLIEKDLITGADKLFGKLSGLHGKKK